MKRYLRILALCLVLALCFGMLPSAAAENQPEAAGQVKPISDAQYALVDTLWDEITQFEQRTMSAMGTTASVADVQIDRVARLVEASDLYVDGTLAWHGDDSFTFMTSAGVACKYSTRLRQLLRDADAQSVTSSSETETISYAAKGGTPDGADVYVIGPYYGIDPDFTQQYRREAQSIAKATGGTYNLYSGSSATIDTVAGAISNGAIVLLDSHGDTDYANGEDYTSGATTSYLCLQSGAGITNADYADGNAYYGGHYGQMYYYLVNGTAISNHMQSDSPHGIVWMAICLGMATDGIFRPLRAHGVEVVYGYSQSVTFDGDYLYEETFWNAMRGGSTVAEAIAAMKQEHGSWDPAYAGYSYSAARSNYAAFPIVVSSEDDYPGKGNVDTYQTVLSTWTMYASSSSYTVRVEVSDPAMGSAVLSGSTITATPNPGCYVAGASVKPEGAAALIRDGDQFTVQNVTQDCTVTVQFAAKARASVTYHVPDGVTQPDSQGYLGESIVLPTPSGTPASDYYHYQFLGWAETPVQETDILPTYYAAGDAYPLTRASATLYALYAYRIYPTGEMGFRLIDRQADDWTGEYVLTGGDSVLRAEPFESSGNAAALENAGMAVQGDLLTGVTDRYVYKAEPVAGTTYYTLRMTNSGKYLALNGSSSVLYAADTADTPAYWAISCDKGKAIVASAQYPSLTLQYNAAAREFGCYLNNQSAVALYGMNQTAQRYTTEPQEPGEHVHKYSVYASQSPTCTEGGYIGYICSCGDTYTEQTAPLGHAYGPWEQVSAAGFHNIGSEQHICTRCGDVQTRSIPAVGCPSKNFQDVSATAWYHSAVDFTVDKGLFSGVTTTAFSPGTPMTRAMLVNVLWRYANRPSAAARAAFTDVKAGKWYTGAIDWAAETGIVSGVTPTLFQPDANITREQTAAILYRFAAYIGEDTSAAGSLGAFTDRSRISGFATSAMRWAVGKGILSGKGNGILDPKGLSSRAEVARMLMQFILITR